MLRRSLASTTVLVSAKSWATPSVCESRRELFECPCLAGILGHFGQLTAAPPVMSSLLSSPIGTIGMLIPMAYTVSHIGLKHCNYTVELFLRDYYQDPLAMHFLRYMVYIGLIIAITHLFCEI